MRRVRAGEREAYRVLVDRYAGLVFGLARRYCDGEAEVEDLAQDIFLRAYDGLAEFREDASFSSWLYAIAANRCRDHLRTRRRDPSLDELEERTDGAPSPALEDGSTPEEELEREERADRLRRALAELRPEYAVPFLLKYEQDLSYREMARLLDATAGALKVRVHRARAELRRLLEDRI